MKMLAEYSCRLNREIALYLTRDGEIVHVAVGTDCDVELTDFRLRRSARRLSRVRCIHTHPDGDGRLSDVDLSALKIFRYDAMTAVGVKDGAPVSVQTAFLEAGEQIGMAPPVAWYRVPDLEWLAQIEISDRLVGVSETDQVCEGPEKAVLMGIDYKTICASNTIGGLYTAGYSVLPSTLAYGYENLNNPYAYDPDAAAAMLDEAGIVDSDGDGVRELDGQPIFLRYSSYENRLLNDFSDANTMYMAELGIGVNPAYGSSDDCWNDLVTFNYDLDNNNWTTVGNGDPTEYMANWYGKSGSNYCGYQNDAYDAAYEKFLETPDAEGRAALLQEMQQILIDDAAVIIDGYYNSSMAYSKNVGHAHIHTADYYWLSTEIVPAE
jgi:hypothetical protein